jgi:hypothetical protein
VNLKATLTSLGLSPRGKRFKEPDPRNMQIEEVNCQFFLDRWAGGGWKNISVHRTYEEALNARAAIRAALGREARA